MPTPFELFLYLLATVAGLFVGGMAYLLWRFAELAMKGYLDADEPR